MRQFMWCFCGTDEDVGDCTEYIMTSSKLPTTLTGGRGIIFGNKLFFNYITKGQYNVQRIESQSQGLLCLLTINCSMSMKARMGR